VSIRVVAGLGVLDDAVSAVVAVARRAGAGPRALDETARGAAVAVAGVAIVALLGTDDDAVSADRRAWEARVRAGPPALERAGRGATVSAARVVIVALLTADEEPVAADRRALARHAGT